MKADHIGCVATNALDAAIVVICTLGTQSPRCNAKPMPAKTEYRKVSGVSLRQPLFRKANGKVSEVETTPRQKATSMMGAIAAANSGPAVETASTTTANKPNSLWVGRVCI